MRLLAGNPGGSGTTDGTGANARFNGPRGVDVDSTGNVYVTDTGNQIIRKITPAGAVTTITNSSGVALQPYESHGIALDSSGNIFVAGGGATVIYRITPAGVLQTFAGNFMVPGTTDGSSGSGRFTFPTDVAIDASGNVYVVDNNAVRKITASGLTVSTLAGASGTSGYLDATGSAARFNGPSGITIDGAGAIYVSDRHAIRQITPAGVVTTIAGSGSTSGTTDGTGTAARFNNPGRLSIDSAGNIYVADSSNRTLRKVTPAGVVTTLAGAAGVAGSTDGTGGAARFTTPTDAAVDASGNIYVTDSSTHVVRKVTAAGVVSTLAGAAPITGSTNGTGSGATFSAPAGLALDAAENVYVADRSNHLIRKISPAGVVTTLAGSGAAGVMNGTGTAASFDSPAGVAVDSSGNVYVADTSNHIIRKITPAGVVTTLAGSGTAGATNGTGAAASFSSPLGVAADSSGNVYVADQGNHLIRKISSAGAVTTLAGSAGTQGNANGTGTAAMFNFPADVKVDATGNVYVADRANYTIRMITPGGVVTTVAGSSSGFVDGTGTNARFRFPLGLGLDSAGTLYVADRDNFAVRKVSPANLVSTVIGDYSRKGVALGSLRASLDLVRGVAVSSSKLYVASENAVLIVTGKP